MTLQVLNLRLQSLNVVAGPLSARQKLHKRLQDSLILEVKRMALAISDVMQLGQQFLVHVKMLRVEEVHHLVRAGDDGLTEVIGFAEGRVLPVQHLAGVCNLAAFV
jgi:hypothetical protein